MTTTSRTPPPARARTDAEHPDWFRAFLTDRATRKPSPHTLQAYRQDFDAIAALIVGDPQRIPALLPLSITKESMRQAFAAYAESHEAASIRRCWSTWNTLCSRGGTGHARSARRRAAAPLIPADNVN
jgi:integrase/recombinase XerC